MLKINKSIIPQIELTTNSVILSGDWSWHTINLTWINNMIQQITDNHINLDARAINYFDTSGAYFIVRLVKECKARGINFNLINFKAQDQKIYQKVLTAAIETNGLTHDSKKNNFLVQLGQDSNNVYQVGLELITFWAKIMLYFFHILIKPKELAWKETLDTINNAGIRGIFIACLLCFLIGVTLTYQMSPQFNNYGANIYIVNFLGISLLREVTPLLTAIIIAGRSGSAITAQLGTMKMQQELDAMQTMGISPMTRLIMPKIIGMMIALPILTMLADIASMLGGMLVAKNTLQIEYSLFIARIQTNVAIINYTQGIIKSIFFALLIAKVGCFCGLKVSTQANSIGTQTTRSVVISILLIVLVDAIFALIFKGLD